MLSIVSGTLNRVHILPDLLKNTVDADNRLELVLVDGGSTDGTVDYLRTLSHQRVRLIELGKRTSYGHFMNTGVRAAKHEYVCQWTDDALLETKWGEVIDNLHNMGFRVLIFAWRKGLPTDPPKDRVYRIDYADDPFSERVMNYGVYHKDVFRKAGLYDEEFQYYCADGDMSYRASVRGFRAQCAVWHKVVSRSDVEHRCVYHEEDNQRYRRKLEKYRKGVVSPIERLK